MNEGPNTTADEQTGEALAGALRAAPNGPVTPPPVADVVERAARRTREQTVRRRVGSIAASVVLIAGGLLVWNSVGGDGQPGSIRTEDLVQGSEDVSPAASVSPPSTNLDPAELSTGPVLDWTEIEGPGDGNGGLLKSLTDGRVLLQTWEDAGGSAVLVTADGRTWEPVPMPSGVMPMQVELGDDRWIVVGASEDVGGGEQHTLHVSDDRGASWQQLDLPDLVETDGYVTRVSSVNGVASFGDAVVLALVPSRTVDIPQLAVDRGLAASPQQVVSWGWNDDRGQTVITIEIRTLPPADVDVGVPGASVPVSEFAEPDSVETFEFSPAELGLPDDINLSLGVAEALTIMVIGSEGVRSTSELPGTLSSSLVNVDGTLAISTRVSPGADTSPAAFGPTLWTSTDAQTWVEAGEPGNGFNPAGQIDGTLWGAGYSSFSVQRMVGDRIEEVSSFPLLGSPTLAIGPGGMAGLTYVSGSEMADGEAMVDDELTESGQPVGVVASRDGIELRLWADGTGTLTATTTGEVLRTFTAEEAAGDELPAGVVEVEDPEFFLRIEDPETGEELVTFREEDYAVDEAAGDASLGYLGATTASVPGSIDGESGAVGEPGPPEPWIAWSADGASWGFESASDAFGMSVSDGTEINPQLAEGDGYVLAAVTAYPFAATTGSESSVPIVRWFVAEVE